MRLGVEAALVDGAIVRGDVEVADGVVRRYGLAGRGRGLALPGLVDLQVNGFGGVDFLQTDADGYRRAGEALLASGVTAYLPTLITAPEERLRDALAAVPAEPSRPRILGVHVEGPFVSPHRLGAHPAASRRDPDLALLDRLLDAGPVRLMTLAPELDGADGLIDRLRQRGVTVALGHSDATAAQAQAAFARGARTVTHLFNAMRPLHHRDPGIAGAALAANDVIVQVIVDRVHLAPETVTLAWRAAAGRVALVTDAAIATRTAGGVLAGSAITMLDALRNLHALGVPLADAATAATEVPARVLGLADVGRLAPGAPADLLVLDDNLELDRVLTAQA